MVIPVKIECDCGQHYAFDVEPENGRMPFSVTCPACGADGTAAANEIVAHKLAANPPVPPIRPVEPPSSSPAKPSVRLAGKADDPVIPIIIPARAAPPPLLSTTSAAPVTASSVTAARLAELNRIDPEQLKHEARAKILWGDSQDDVVKFLMLKGMTYSEAAMLTVEFFKERTATIRANGIRKILIGAGLISIPLITLLTFLLLGVISIKLLGITGVIGLYGAWLALNGILMVLAPRSEQGDASGDD